MVEAEGNGCRIDSSPDGDEPWLQAWWRRPARSRQHLTDAKVVRRVILSERDIALALSSVNRSIGSLTSPKETKFLSHRERAERLHPSNR